MKEIHLRQSREFGDIISDTFGYLRVHFKTLGKGLLYFSLPLIIISGVLIGSSFSTITAISDSIGNPEILDEMSAFGLKFIVGLFLFILTFVFIVVIVFKHMQLVDDGEEHIEPSLLLEGAFRNIFGLIGIYLLTVFLTIIGFLFFIIPGIIIAIKLSLAPSIYIIEKCDFEEAIRRSWSITNNYWWFTFGVNFVISLIMNIVSNIVIFPFYIVSMVIVFSTGEPDMELFGSLFGVMYGLVMIIIGLLYCFPIISQALVYFNLDERKNGNSLFQKIDALGSN